MRVRFNRNVPALLCGALLIVVGSGWAIDAQGPSPAARQTVPSSPTVKKPLSYDAYRLLAIDSGNDLVARRRMARVRADRGGGRRRARRPQPARRQRSTSTHAVRIQRSPRTGTSSPSRLRKPRRTRNAIVLRRSATASPKAAVKARTKVKASRNAISRKTGAGIMALATGQVSIGRARGQRQHPGRVFIMGRDASRQWRRGAGAVRGGRGAGGRGAPPPAGRGRGRRESGSSATVRRAASARMPGSDLIVRNLTTGRRHHDPAGHRLRVVEGRFVARVRGFIQQA